jgi:hypothetical protein
MFDETKAVHLDRLSAAWSCSSKVRHLHVGFRALARFVRDNTLGRRAAYVRQRTERPGYPVIPAQGTQASPVHSRQFDRPHRGNALAGRPN